VPRGAPSLLSLLPLLSLAAPAAAQLASLPQLAPDTQVEITADRLTREKDGLVRALGSARVTAGDLRVAGEELTYDPDRSELQAIGRTTVRDGAYVLRAQHARIDLRTHEGTFENVELYEKRQVLPFEALVAADDLQAPGTNKLMVTAERIHRLENGELVAENPRVTTCDCGDGEAPSWRFAASSAHVVPDESVSLVFPRLELPRLPAPPLPFPYISLPLSHRKTGLLVPDLAYTARRGAQVETPIFLVLGRSYDATVSPAYFTGPFGDRPPAFQGPRLTTEFRYAPRDDTAGRVMVAYAHDLSKRELTPEQLAQGQEELVSRYAVQLSQHDIWSEHLADRLDVSLVSDRRYVSDFTDEVRLQGQQVTRSVGWVDGRDGTALLSASSVYTQDLRPRPDPTLLSPEAAALARLDSLRLFGERNTRVTFQRVPVLQLDLVHFDVGPAAASMELEAARIAPVGAHYFADAGLDGLAVGDTGWIGPDAGEKNGRLDRLPGHRGGTPLQGTGGEQTAVTRFSVRPTISAPFLAPPYLAIRPYAGWRQNMYLYDGLDDGTAGWGLLGAELTSQLARTYPGVGLRHAILPRLEVRHLVPGPGTGVPPRPYDELDLGPRVPNTQAEAAVTSRLDPLAGGPTLEATLGQDLLLFPDVAAAETFASGSLQLGPLWTAAGLRWDTRADYMSEASVRGTLRSSRGDELRAGYLRVGRGGSRRLRAGPDELFATEPLIRELAGVSQLTGGATAALSRYTSIRYDILWLFTYDQPLVILDILGRQEAQRVGALQQTAGFSYRSPCNCWGLGVLARYRRGQTGPPDIFFNLDLANP
jgi:hypothetical protein